MAPSSPPHDIDARDFDANHAETRDRDLLDRDDGGGLMSMAAQRILDRDRRRMRTEVIRIGSFICALLSCLCAGSITTFSLYGPRFLTDLHYSQLRINAVSITAELGMYLPIPFFGFLCDRYSPRPLSLLASIFFGAGYLLAAFTYQAGPPPDAVNGGTGYPFSVMILAFVGVGCGTSCMYISAVSTCAKNFSKSKSKGLILAIPLAGVGLSGVWLSQVGARLLYERLPGGDKGDVDVFRYFVFLSCILFAVGLLGAVGLNIVEEEEMIERGIEDLEQSGLLNESEFFKPQDEENEPLNQNHHHHRHDHQPSGYGALPNGNHATGATADNRDADQGSTTGAELTVSESNIVKKQQEEEELHRKKSWLLNHETHTFFADRNMWLLAAGFFLLTGPGEAYLNNVGTVIPALTPAHQPRSSPPLGGSSSTHVSIIALTSTSARLISGTLSDILSSSSSPSLFTSRLTLLVPAACLELFGFLSLALPFLVPLHPSILHLTSVLLGLSYGACFSLAPIIVSIVWGVENFATNWGFVAMMPAGGAAVWSIVYSVGYSRATTKAPSPYLGDGRADNDGECRGMACYQGWAAGCAGSVTVAILFLMMAWRNWRRKGVVV